MTTRMAHVRFGASAGVAVSLILFAGCNLLWDITSGDPLPCEPGTVEHCYSGPPGTEGTGPCRGGTTICKADGSGYSECVGELTPEPEDCTTSIDEDCDGDTLDMEDECECEPNTVKSCYSGAENTEGIGACMAGVKVCNPLGKDYGSCVGQVLPAAEICETATDESCDGDGKCPGGHVWSKGFGDVASVQRGQSVATDNAGNVFLTGIFSGDVDFGGGPLSSAGDFDIFAVKLDPTGSHLWSRRFGDIKTQFGVSIATDSVDNSVLAGYIAGSVDFGGGVLSTSGSHDMLVVKFNAAGDHLWSKRFGDSDGQYGAGIATDRADNIVLTGNCAGVVDFGGGPLPSAGGYDICIVKFDPSGKHLWSKRYGDVGVAMLDQIPSGVATDAADNIIMTGTFEGEMSFDGGMISSAGGQDIFVAKIDSSGSHIWSKRFGDASDIQRGQSIATDRMGNIILTGFFRGSVDFGGGPLTASGQANDIFIAKLNPSGQHTWSKRFGSAGHDWGQSVATDDAGNIIMTGYFESSGVDFGGGVLLNAGAYDAFVIKLDAGGALVWSRSFGDGEDQRGQSVATDSTGHIFLLGDVEGIVDFGGGPLTDAGPFDNVSLIKLTP